MAPCSEEMAPRSELTWPWIEEIWPRRLLSSPRMEEALPLHRADLAPERRDLPLEAAALAVDRRNLAAQAAHLATQVGRVPRWCRAPSSIRSRHCCAASSTGRATPPTCQDCRHAAARPLPEFHALHGAPAARFQHDAARAADPFARPSGVVPVAGSLGHHAQPQVAERLLNHPVAAARADLLVDHGAAVDSRARRAAAERRPARRIPPAGGVAADGGLSGAGSRSGDPSARDPAHRGGRCRHRVGDGDAASRRPRGVAATRPCTAGLRRGERQRQQRHADRGNQDHPPGHGAGVVVQDGHQSVLQE